MNLDKTRSLLQLSLSLYMSTETYCYGYEELFRRTVYGLTDIILLSGSVSFVFVV